MRKTIENLWGGAGEGGNPARGEKMGCKEKAGPEDDSASHHILMLLTLLWGPLGRLRVYLVSCSLEARPPGVR